MRGLSFRRNMVVQVPSLFLWVLVVSVLGVGGCGGPEERKAKYIEKAQEYMGEGNYPKARVALRNVLKIDPKDPQGYFLYAQVEEKEKNWREAYLNYLRVIELEPDHRGALLKLGQFYLEGKALDKVIEVADKVLAKNPADAEARGLHAAVTAANGDIPKAITTLQEILAEQPNHPDSVILLATLYTAQKQMEKARSVLQVAVQAHESDIKLLATLGSVLVRMQEWDGAEIAFQRLVDLQPTEFDHRIRLAAFYLQAQQPAKAESALKKAMALEPDDPDRRLALAEIQVTLKNYAGAEMTLMAAQEDLPHALKIPFALAQLYELQDQKGKARQVYESLADAQSSEPAGLEAQVKLAALDLAEGFPDRAEKRLDLVLEESPRASEALILKGKMALSNNQGDDAVRMFRTVLKDQPNAAPVHTLLGRAYILTGEASLAKESLEQAISLNAKQWDAQRLLANLEAGQGRTQEAKARLEEILEARPKDVETLGMLFSLQMSKREWGGIDTTLQRLREAGAEQLSTHLAEANVYLAQKHWDKAIRKFELAKEMAPDDPRPLFGIIQVESQRGRPDQARARLEQVIAQDPNHPMAHGLLGEILVVQGEKNLAIQEFSLATELNPKWVVPWIDYATLELGEQRHKEAIQVLRKGLQSNPQSHQMRLLLASTLNEIGDVESAIQEYETILKESPKTLLAANNLATLLADKKGDPKSLERALTLSQSFERMDNQPFFLDTLGWIYTKLGRSEEAVRVIRRAVTKAPDHPILNYHLGVAYYQVGNSKEAEIHLSRALQKGQAFEGKENAQALLKQIRG